MAKTMDLNQPPFPRLAWQASYWSGMLELPSWTGALDCSGPYGNASEGEVSDGIVNLHVNVVERNPPAVPSAGQSAALQFLLDNEATVAQTILAALFAKYPQWREDYAGAWGDAEEASDYLPELTAAEEMKNVVGMATVHLLPLERDGVAYLGFELGCTWDEEHGVGVMMHQARIVEVGSADTSFNEWVAKEDMAS